MRSGSLGSGLGVENYIKLHNVAAVTQIEKKKKLEKCVFQESGMPLKSFLFSTEVTFSSAGFPTLSL